MSLPEWLPGPMFLPGGSLFRGSLSRGFSVQGVSVQWVSVQLVSGGSLSKVVSTPSNSEEREVRILLESFLVIHCKHLEN